MIGFRTVLARALYVIALLLILLRGSYKFSLSGMGSTFWEHKDFLLGSLLSWSGVIVGSSILDQVAKKQCEAIPDCCYYPHSMLLCSSLIYGSYFPVLALFVVS